MPQPRGAMAQALREAFEGAPTVKAQAEQAEAAETAPDEVVDEPVLEAEPVEPVEGEQDEAGGEVRSINDLPEALGWEPEDFYALPISLKDGKDPVPLGEIKDRLQSVETERQEIARQREALEEQEKQLQQQAIQFGQANNAASEEMMKAVAEKMFWEGQYPELQNRWNQLKADPKTAQQAMQEEWEFSKKLSTANAALQQAQSQATQQQQQAFANWKKQEIHKVMEAVPDFRDPAKGKVLAEKINSAAQHYGYTAQEMEMMDSRAVRLLLDAADGIDAKRQAKEVVAKVKSARPVVPKGVRLKQNARQKQHVAELEQQARQSKSRPDLLKAMRGVLGEKGIN